MNIDIVIKQEVSTDYFETERVVQAALLNEESIESLSLAPVSVLPAFQNIGVGTQLMNEAFNE